MNKKLSVSIITSIIAVMSFSFIVTSCKSSEKKISEIQDVVDLIYKKASSSSIENPYKIKGVVTKRFGDYAFIQNKNSKTNKIDAIKIKGLNSYANNVKDGDEVTIDKGRIRLIYNTPTLTINRENLLKVTGSTNVDPLVYQGIEDYVTNGLATTTANNNPLYAYSRYIEIKGVEVTYVDYQPKYFGEEMLYYGDFADLKDYFNYDKNVYVVTPEERSQLVTFALKSSMERANLVNLKGIAYYHDNTFMLLVQHEDDVQITDKPAFDDNVITSRRSALMIEGYNYNKNDFAEDELTLYFLKNKADIPYVEVGEFMEQRDYLIYRGNYFPVSRSEYQDNPNITQYRIGNGNNIRGYFLVDSENDMFIAYENGGYLMYPYTKTQAGINILGQTNDEAIKIDDERSKFYVRPSYYEAYNLGQFNIDIVKDKYGNMYAPLTVMGDILFSTIGYGFGYNGKDYYYYNGMGDSLVNERYYSESPFAQSLTKSEEMAEYTYNALCFSLKYVYGLREIRGITNPDAFLTNFNFKDLIKSTNNDEYGRGINLFAAKWLYEGHAGLTYQSPSKVSDGLNLKDIYSSNLREHNERYNQLWGAHNKLTALRNNAQKKVGLDIYDNKMAVIRFDEYVKYEADNSKEINVDDYSYEDLEVMGSELLFEKAFKEITQIPTIEDIVIDNSLNTGGHINAIAFLEAYMTAHPSLTTYHMNQGEVSEVYYKVDLNYDGTYGGAGDTYEGQYNFYILNSKSSFSCGNFLPTIMKSRNLGKLVGQPSGGGVCVVGGFATACGTFLRNSQNRQMGYYDEEQEEFVCFENGIEPDIKFTEDNFYDLEKLYNAIHQ